MDRQTEFRTVLFPSGTTTLGLTIRKTQGEVMMVGAKSVSRELGVEVGDIIIGIAGMTMRGDVGMVESMILHELVPLPIKFMRHQVSGGIPG